MSGRIDFQIAENALVMTRWQWDYQPSTWLMSLAMIGGRNPIPVVNVFRFADGKIVEIWNHRHDIDTGQTLRFTLQGLAIGLGIALLPTVYAVVLRRRLRSAGASRSNNVERRPAATSRAIVVLPHWRGPTSITTGSVRNRRSMARRNGARAILAIIAI